MKDKAASKFIQECQEQFGSEGMTVKWYDGRVFVHRDGCWVRDRSRERQQS